MQLHEHSAHGVCALESSSCVDDDDDNTVLYWPLAKTPRSWDLVIFVWMMTIQTYIFPVLTWIDTLRPVFRNNNINAIEDVQMMSSTSYPTHMCKG